MYNRIPKYEYVINSLLPLLNSDNRKELMFKLNFLVLYKKIYQKDLEEMKAYLKTKIEYMEKLNSILEGYKIPNNF